MSYGETKVYFDGSHYIAIPYVPNPFRRRKKAKVDSFESGEKGFDSDEELDEFEGVEKADKPLVYMIEKMEKNEQKPADKSINDRKVNKKELFERLYLENLNEKKWVRRKKIIQGMKGCFKDEEITQLYVDSNLGRKERNLICRRIRLTRKANLQEFNYFCTFTYDGAIHTEDSFKKDLKTTLRNFCYRKGWKYIGVWERSPEKKRLHFHGLFYIPEGTMPSELEKKTDYSFHTHKRETINQSIYFLRRFGRNDFEEIEDRNRLGDAIAYLMKYIEKTGEKIVYSKGLPQFFISDIMDEDVVCRMGREDKKLLLFDDFTCWDEGEYIGKVSKEVIEQMRKCA